MPVLNPYTFLIAGRVEWTPGHEQGFADGPATQSALFNEPHGVVIGADGSIFVADHNNHRIRCIRDDVVTTFAGSGVKGGADGVGAAAQFKRPSGLALGPGGILYVTETGGKRVRMISPAGAVTTLAGNDEQGFAEGPVATARFYRPTGIAVDAAGVVFVADGHRIRRIRDGVVDTLAGSGAAGAVDGVGAAAQFNFPTGLALDPTTGNLLVIDTRRNLIRNVDPRTGTVTTLPIGGGGNHHFRSPMDATAIELSSLSVITVDTSGTLYVGDGRGIIRLDNVRRIREQARDVKNALLGNLFIDRDRVMDPAKEAAVSRHAARVAHPLRSGDDAVSRSTESGIITANIGKFLVGETAEPERGQLTNPHTLLTHLRNQHDGREWMMRRPLTAPAHPLSPAAPVPPAAAPPPPPPPTRNRVVLPSPAAPVPPAAAPDPGPLLEDEPAPPFRLGAAPVPPPPAAAPVPPPPRWWQRRYWTRRVSPEPAAAAPVLPRPRWWQREYWTRRGGRSRKTRRRMKNPCWKGYTAYGMKKGGPNCVPIKSRRQRRRV